MRFVVTAVRPSCDVPDHAEFDDFRESVVNWMQGDEFIPFWMNVDVPKARRKRAPQAPPVRSELITLFAALCVT